MAEGNGMIFLAGEVRARCGPSARQTRKSIYRHYEILTTTELCLKLYIAIYRYYDRFATKKERRV